MLLFKKGGVRLAPKGIDILEKVAFVLAKFAYHIITKCLKNSVKYFSQCFSWSLPWE
jgi:hypothetical protein